ncbi:MAG: membrane protein insertion efficiency factor YidD [Candidatus Latescibacterota bacterium]
MRWLELGPALARDAALLAIRFYRSFVSPFLPRSCRFYPSCSEYAAECVARFGLWRGGLRAARRLMRCHPWGGCGCDPVE